MRAIAKQSRGDQHLLTTSGLLHTEYIEPFGLSPRSNDSWSKDVFAMTFLKEIMQKDILVKENQEVFLPILWTGEESQLSYNVYLAEKGAKVTLLGLLLGKQSDRVDIKTTVFHKSVDTHSEIILKGALTDTSSVNYEGLVKIEPGAKGTKAWLAAHLLLLSPKSKGRAIPSLEILENDIKAGHATTVGRVNDMELFYLMSRGLSKEVATGLIVEGFVQSVLEKFPSDFQLRAKKDLKLLIPNN